MGDLTFNKAALRSIRAASIATTDFQRDLDATIKFDQTDRVKNKLISEGNETI